MSRKMKRIWKGVAAGAAGGLAGAWAMNQFQALWSQTVSSGGSGNGADESATIKAARTLSEKVLGHCLGEREKKAAGAAMHYVFGTANGALYGALAALAPKTRAGAGTAFGAGLFLVADELMVPLLGWSKPPQKYPLSSHAYGLASHLVYGAAADEVRGLVLRAL